MPLPLSTPPNRWSTTPAMAYENGTYYLFSTGENIQEMTSADMRTWTLKSKGPLSGKIPAWTRDSVPGFRNHVWAPDVVRFNGRWYMAYSVSTFGRNISAIGLLSNDRLSDTGGWKDEGCIIASRGGATTGMPSTRISLSATMDCRGSSSAPSGTAYSSFASTAQCMWRKAPAPAPLPGGWRSTRERRSLMVAPMRRRQITAAAPMPMARAQTC